MKEEKNIVLVGLGPHSKRIYINNIKKYNLGLKLIIDLNSKKDVILNYIKDNNLKDVETYFIQDANKDDKRLSFFDEKNIKDLIKKLSIKYAIISTEPKSHFTYIKFFLIQNLNILTDKPLTAPINVSTNIEKAKQILEEYTEIKDLFSKKQYLNFQVQCQRRYHKGYKFIYNLLQDIVNKYEVPITSIHAQHCDGMWNMPNEFIERENHPYKYGYGKLFHSGYHFIDLISWFQQINLNLKRCNINNVDLVLSEVRPLDFFRMIDKRNYTDFFNTNKFDDIFDNLKDYDFNKYGEIDLYSILQFKENDNVISTVTLNLMQNGFSRRSWCDLPEDAYKSNGRVRHEYLNVSVGHFINIQVHSYQCKEIKDRNFDNNDVGEVEHFDIFIFRNIDLIGGKPFEKITLKNLHNNEDEYLGYNEMAREKCLIDFLNDEKGNTSIYEQELGILILSKLYEEMSIKHLKQRSRMNFKI